MFHSEICEYSKMPSKSKSDIICDKYLSLNELIQKLHDAFKTDMVDIDHVQMLMSSYQSNPQDWKKYAKFDRHR